MTRWNIEATGDAPDGLHDEIAERLGKLLGLVKFGTDASQFSGTGHNGPVHLKAEAADDEPAEADGTS